MINANELRIGNYINTLTGTVKIEYFHKLDGAHFSDGNGGNFNSMQPISLTPEILERFGFELASDKNSFAFITDKIIIEANYDDENISWFFGQTVIKYLHHIQNLFFDLTGEELKPNPAF